MNRREFVQAFVIQNSPKALSFGQPNSSSSEIDAIIKWGSYVYKKIEQDPDIRADNSMPDERGYLASVATPQGTN